MGNDAGKPDVRERLWITKVDHEADPPRPVEEIFIENGAVVSVRDLRTSAPEEQKEDA